MTLAAGSRLGPYEILAGVGAGGMGEVYRAKDTRLDRERSPSRSCRRITRRTRKSGSASSARRRPIFGPFPSAHLRALRRRQPRRDRVPRHGVPVGGEPRGPSPQGLRSARPGPALRNRDRRRAGQGAPAGGRSPGPDRGRLVSGRPLPRPAITRGEGRPPSQSFRPLPDRGREAHDVFSPGRQQR